MKQRCSHCKKVKFFKFFPRNPKNGKANGYGSWCQKCVTRARWEWKQNPKNKLWLKNYQRSYALKKNFGLTIEAYAAMLKGQKNCCAICRSKSPNPKSQFVQNFYVDHDHKTEKIRGLLCGNCNQGLGRFQDSKALLHRAIRYLK